MNSVIFSGIGCFEETSILQVKEGIQPYQVPPRRIACSLQKPLKEELEMLQRQQVIVPLGVAETSK